MSRKNVEKNVEKRREKRRETSRFWKLKNLINLGSFPRKKSPENPLEPLKYVKLAFFKTTLRVSPNKRKKKPLGTIQMSRFQEIWSIYGLIYEKHETIVKKNPPGIIEMSRFQERWSIYGLICEKKNMKNVEKRTETSRFLKNTQIFTCFDHFAPKIREKTSKFHLLSCQTPKNHTSARIKKNLNPPPGISKFWASTKKLKCLKILKTEIFQVSEECRRGRELFFEHSLSPFPSFPRSPLFPLCPFPLFPIFSLSPFFPLFSPLPSFPLFSPPPSGNFPFSSFPIFSLLPFFFFSPLPSFPLFPSPLFSPLPISPLFHSPFSPFFHSPLSPLLPSPLSPLFPSPRPPSPLFSPLPLFPSVPSFPLTPVPSFPLSPPPSFPSPLSARLSQKTVWAKWMCSVPPSSSLPYFIFVRFLGVLLWFGHCGAV